MDSKTIGNTISSLRKKNGMTQATLAARLGVSDKAVSKWENGQGYPDVTLFPVLADVFGVPVNVTYGAHSGAVGAAKYALK